VVYHSYKKKLGRTKTELSLSSAFIVPTVSLCLSRISLDFSVALLGLLGLDMTGKVMIDHTPR